MTSLKLSVDKLLKQLHHDKQPSVFSFLQYDDLSTKETMYRCPLYHSTQCAEKFFPSNSNQNLNAIFYHIYKLHPPDRELIKKDFNQWYTKLKNSSASSNLQDVLTSHDVEELFEGVTTTRTTTYNEDQRKIIIFNYQQAFNELTGLIHKEMELFTNGYINGQQLKIKIKAFNKDFIKKIEKL